MVAPVLTALPLVTLLAAASAGAGRPPVTASAAATDPAPLAPDSAAADTSRRRPRIWRQFPVVEVRAPLHDLRSSETVHLVTPQALRTLPADELLDAIRTQPGVVVDGEDLHVRGGRTGEVDQVVDGVTLNDGLRHRPMNVPLLALRGIELVSGGQDAEYGGALAGVLLMRTEDPTDRWSTAWRYSTDARLDTHYDQASARIGGPLPVHGLGLVAAGDVMGDDTWLPTTRSASDRSILGIHFGWRTENRFLGWAKLAPLVDPQRGSLQVFASRERHEPMDPAWTKDGWYTPCADDSCLKPGWSTTQPEGPRAWTWSRYKAADHLAVTDERRLGSIFTISGAGPNHIGSLALGWIHEHSVRSPTGAPGDGFLLAEGAPALGLDGTVAARWEDPFYVYWGDDPLYRETRSDEFSLRADQSWSPRPDVSARAGLGATWDDVSLVQLDATLFKQQLDSLRQFHTHAPGAFAYAQTRWRYQGMVLNLGLRAQGFTAGADAPGSTSGNAPRARWSLSPRLGVAYPVSVHDVFSLAYVRLEQDPAREFLYENRARIENDFPLGNPYLVPATLVSYQGALKHLFTDSWAMQIGTFFRDGYGEVGARNFEFLPGAWELRYTNDDEFHTMGFEASLLHETGRRRAELSYTWMQAYGNESLPGGDVPVYVPGSQTPPVSDKPLSWDRRHSLGFNGHWPLFERWTLSWSTLVGSGLPWTPKVRREVFDDPALVNAARLDWTENTDISVRWDPPILPVPLTFGLEVRNLFDHRGDRQATIDGYPHAVINTIYDDYGAYRTETGQGGGAYWFDADGDGVPEWVPVHDPRLQEPPRRIRVSLGAHW